MIRSPQTLVLRPVSAFLSWIGPARLVLGIAVVLSQAPGHSSAAAEAARSAEPMRLPKAQAKRGEDVLKAFEAVSRGATDSVVKLDVQGTTVALGAVVDSRGWVITKASQIQAGKLTAWLASGREVPAKVLARDEENDVALVEVSARGLKPVEWAAGRPRIGQWAITPGIASTPQAVGILSASPRRIPHARALLGVQLARGGSEARVDEVMKGFGAEKAGVTPGDVIIAVNGEKVSAGDEVIRRLRELREGLTVTLRLRRAGSELEVPVVLRRSDEGGEDRNSGPLSDRSEGFERVWQHDTVLKPWQCGGPLLDLDGKVIGLNIARADRVSTYALTAEVARSVSDKLRSRVSKK